jgi:formate hydrogenlyase subunit 4
MNSIGTTLLLCAVNGAVALLLSPLYEGIMRKLKAHIHSRKGPPLIQPYLDILKLLGKEDLRTTRSILYTVAPAVALGSTLMIAMLIPIGAQPPLGFAGDIIVLLYVSAICAVMMMLTGYASSSPYAYIGSSREMMMMLTVEPVLVLSLVVGALKAQTLSTGGIAAWQLQNGPTLSTVLAAIALFLTIQAQAGKLPFDIAEAEQEIMGGFLIEQSGPRLALFRWAILVKQLVFSFLLVEVFIPWPRTGIYAVDVLIAAAKVLVVLVLVALVDVVNPRLRIDQAMGYFMRIGLFALAALVFAMMGT